MKLLKRGMILGLTCMMVCTICSCKSKKKDYIDLENGESGITIKDKEVVYQIKEEFNKDYYSEDDVEKQVKDEIDEFVRLEGKDSAELDEFEVEDGSCHVVITFAGLNEFCDYVNGFKST